VPKSPLSNLLPANVGAITDATRIVDVFDSLAFLDFFLKLESEYGSGLSLDAVVTCETFADLVTLIASLRPAGEA
jgi:acyl carrier protein